MMLKSSKTQKNLQIHSVLASQTIYTHQSPGIIPFAAKYGFIRVIHLQSAIENSLWGGGLFEPGDQPSFCRNGIAKKGETLDSPDRALRLSTSSFPGEMSTIRASSCNVISEPSAGHGARQLHIGTLKTRRDRSWSWTPP